MSAGTMSMPEGEDLDVFDSKCAACDIVLEIPWICCVQCQPNQHICSRCFSFGVEFGQHENDHPYMVMRYNFPMYEASWTAAEEIRLLESIQEYGLGNWPAVSGRMRVKSAEDCERHYFKYYVENPQPPLPEFDDPVAFDKGAPVVFKLSDNPPRPPEGSTLSIEMAGYSAARGDFDVEYDNYIELDICHMTFSEEDDGIADTETEDDNFYKDLKLSVLDVYRNCLIERQRRKKIIRDYGLINARKWYGMLKRRYEPSIPLGFLRPFMRLFSPFLFDKYMESLHYEKQLKSDILRLQELRKNGITRLRLVKAYYQMKQRRDHTKAQRSLFIDVLNHVKDEQSYLSWLAKQAGVEGSSKNPLAHVPSLSSRKVIPHLKIDGLPGYEKLSEAERQMCSEVRLVPMAYLEFARILTSECSKLGFLRLAQARTLIKIDVNKTRKLYDFLIKEGHINKDPL